MKKGFTLIELLAVIVILGIIATIVMVTSTRIINSSKESLSETQEKTLINAAKKYVIYNDEGMPTDTNDEPKYVSLSDLESSGYIDSGDLINPKTNETITGCIEITYDKQYNYKFITDASKCDTTS